MVGWLNIQPFLHKVQRDLQPGQLVHGEHFSLFEAMCALEIGNPKTDAAATVKAHDLPEDRSVATAKLAPLDVSLEQVLIISDRLMACEVSWQRGHTLPQTVFSCLYLLYPERWVASSCHRCTTWGLLQKQSPGSKLCLHACPEHSSGACVHTVSGARCTVKACRSADRSGGAGQSTTCRCKRCAKQLPPHVAA